MASEWGDILTGDAASLPQAFFLGEGYLLDERILQRVLVGIK